MTGRRLGLATLIALLVAPAAAHAASFTQEGLANPTGTDSYGVVTQDFNRDGFPDVAVVNGTSSDLSVYLRQPTGGFVQEAGSPIRLGGGSNYAASGDFDNNGYPDIAVSNFTASYVTILLRQPGGGFTTGHPGPDRWRRAGRSRPPTSTATASWTSPLPSTTPARSACRVRSGQRHVLRPANASGRRESARQIAVGDFNGDRVPDLAVANLGSDTVSILIRGATAFTTEATIPVGDAPSGLATGDFNRDGKDSTSP